MRKITEVLRLKFEAKLSHDQIARAVGLSKGGVGKYVSLAKAQGLSWPLPEGLDDGRLEALLFPPPPALLAGQRAGAGRSAAADRDIAFQPGHLRLVHVLADLPAELFHVAVGPAQFVEDRLERVRTARRAG